VELSSPPPLLKAKRLVELVLVSELAEQLLVDFQPPLQVVIQQPLFQQTQLQQRQLPLRDPNLGHNDSTRPSLDRANQGHPSIHRDSHANKLLHL
jgi:hypothetical protein